MITNIHIWYRMIIDITTKFNNGDVLLFYRIFALSLCDASFVEKIL